ncbi:MAG: hypothetical protein HOW73_39200 [Polyangiaceae bacterium]|nr:hypothetical protein [Polyangiaceae bacterium]
MPVELAARLGDEVGHTKAVEWMKLGLCIAGAIVVTVATGGVAAIAAGATITASGAMLAAGGAMATIAGGGLLGLHLGEAQSDGPSCSVVESGSEDTFIEGKEAARAGVDTVGHDDDVVATGAATVFVNRMPLARIGEETQCGGKLIRTSVRTFIGGDSGSVIPENERKHEAGNAPLILQGLLFGGLTLMTGGLASGYMAAGWSGWAAWPAAGVRVLAPVAGGAAGTELAERSARALGTSEFEARLWGVGGGFLAGGLGGRAGALGAQRIGGRIGTLSEAGRAMLRAEEAAGAEKAQRARTPGAAKPISGPPELRVSTTSYTRASAEPLVAVERHNGPSALTEVSARSPIQTGAPEVPPDVPPAPAPASDIKLLPYTRTESTPLTEIGRGQTETLVVITDNRVRRLHGQEEPRSCAIASCRMVIETKTGRDLGEAALRKQSSEMMLGYHPMRGTGMASLGELLRQNGVKDAAGRRAMTVDELAAATKTGDPAIVCLDHLDAEGIDRAWHAVVVDGVITNADGTRSVLIRDPQFIGNVPKQMVMPEAQFLNDYYGVPHPKGWRTQYDGTAVTTDGSGDLTPDWN